jgi:hypothetical protein
MGMVETRKKGMVETRKERSDRQLTELLNELRVALPGAQVLLAFLLAGSACDALRPGRRRGEDRRCSLH